MESFNIIEKLHSISEAQSIIMKSNIRYSIRIEEVRVEESIGKVAAEDVRSPMDIPPVDRSVLDGYAAKWVDLSVASEESPVRLGIAGSIPIDSGDAPELRPGEAYEVATGSPIPRGADVVVPVEYTRRLGDVIEVYRPFPGGYGVSVRGEDLREGEIILNKGDIISEWHIGVLASVGISRVTVWRPIRAALYATGLELIEPGEPWRPGKVYSSTTRAVYSYFISRNVKPEYLGILPDDIDVIESALRDALSRYDIVVTTGGTSVGRKDATIRAIHRLADDIVHGLALTPGRPGAFAIVDGKLVIALSGMPVAAISELIAVWDPVYRRLLGREKPWEPVVEARMRSRFTSHPGMVNVVRSQTCYSGGSIYTTPLRVTGSGILSTLIRANSLFIVPEELTGIEEGDLVEVRLTGYPGRC
ncbi:MAG: molybdopterin molybdotransferase MoeA [Desulfurococcales archaeon]|nr:molybdopterin molybdotransferase MoeA [Desulfurococcales archaeon]